MSPLNRGPHMSQRMPPTGMRPPMSRYGRGPPPPPPPMTRGLPPLPPLPPVNPMFGGPRRRPVPPPPMARPVPGPGPMMARPGPHGPPHHFRGGPMPPMPPMPPMGMRGPMGPRGPMMRPGPRGMLPPHALPHMRPRFPPHTNGKAKSNNKKNKFNELELKKPWMTDEIRSEIQKKNKLYAKAKKNKDAKEWEEFKDLRNKVTRMIRDAKSEYLAKNPDQVHLYESDDDNDDASQFDSNSEDSESEEPITPYCEICDRDFYSEELLEKHIQEHETCNIDGCTFTAHPKIVEKHISMQHYTGLYQRMKNLMSDEDIEKWKAERKKRYPTAVNVKLQEDKQLEKEKRGEVIKNTNIKTRGPFQRQQQQHQQRKGRRKRRNRTFKAQNYEEIAPELTTYRGLKPFQGTAVLDELEHCVDSVVENQNLDNNQETCNFEVSDDEEHDDIKTCELNINNTESIDIETVVSAKTKLITPTVPSFSLVADYGSDSENGEPPDEVPIKKLKLNHEEIQAEEIQIEEKTEKLISRPESLCEQKTESPSIVSEKPMVKKDRDMQRNKKKSNRPQKLSNSDFSNGRLRLLNKLLARSIQHERNSIFQCITFIAKNNFFD